MKMLKDRLLLLCMSLLLLAFCTFGEYLYWWPLSGNDWGTAINWAYYYSGGWYDAWVPTANDHVKFGFEDWGDAPCYVTGTANCRAISIVDIGQLRISGGTLNISGVWSGEQSSLVVYHNGDYRQTSGTVNLTATNTSLEHNLWVGIDLADPRYPTFNMLGGTINQTNYYSGTGGYSGDIGKCFVVDATANISGGTINLDDDFILHGTINHSGGTINTGWDSNNGGVWVSGSPGKSARYYLSGSGVVNVERYMFTSGYNADPYGFGLGTGRFQATGGTVGLTKGDAASGKVYVYDGGSSHSFFNNVEAYGLTTIEATSGNYMWVNGSMFLIHPYGKVRPFSAIRFPGGAFGRIIDLGDISEIGPETPTLIEDSDETISFSADARQTIGGAAIEINSPSFERSILELYDISGRVIHSRSLELFPGRSSHAIEMDGFASGVYYYRISSAKGDFTGKLVNIR